MATFPYAIHTVLTDNGIAFVDLPENRGFHPEIEAIFGGHIFDRVCDEHGIEHKLTKPCHPWTNGQSLPRTRSGAERMNRTVKEATLRAFHSPDLEALRVHVPAFVRAYNFAEHPKGSGGGPLSRPSATPGPVTPPRSGLTRATSSRDQTPSFTCPVRRGRITYVGLINMQAILHQATSNVGGMSMIKKMILSQLFLICLSSNYEKEGRKLAQNFFYWRNPGLKHSHGCPDSC